MRWCYRYFLVADTIAHEMSHLWCGDLVTMSWWSDLWLNVSFLDGLSCASMQANELCVKDTEVLHAIDHMSLYGVGL